MMKTYQCFKRVKAAKIEAITDRYMDPAVLDSEPVATLRFAGGASVRKNGAWMQRHRPQVGGYYVDYEDGYSSFSPAAAFEGGYKEVVPAYSAELDPEYPTPAAHPQLAPSSAATHGEVKP
jgi:hypothetical protein